MQKKFCGACGTKLKPDDKFCSKCGKPTNNTQPPKIDITPPTTDVSIPKQVAPSKKNETETKTQTVSQNQKKLLTDTEIKAHIKAGTTFLAAIVMTIVGCVCLAFTSLNGAFLIFGGMFIIAAIWKFISTFKKIKQIKSYTLVLRECLAKKVQEYDEGDDSYLLYFAGYKDGIGCLVAIVKKEDYEKANVGDLYYLAVTRSKNSTHDVAAYFRESEWRLD